MAKRAKARVRAARRRDSKPRMAVTLTASQVHRQVQQWRTLKTRFDRVHRAGVAALKRKDYGRFGVAILQERRIIEQLRTLVDVARAQVRRWKLVSRRV